jgi:hypothetical protein
MSARKIAIGAAVAVIAAAVATLLVMKARHRSIALTGVVLQQNSDPRKQLPIPNAKISAAEDGRSVTGASNAAGLFELKLPNGGWRNQPVTLSVQHPGYRPLETTPLMNGELFVFRMKPDLAPVITAPAAVLHEVTIKDVRIRYAERNSSPVNVGSAAKTFTVPNVGNVPCNGKPPCSPNGKWKAAVGGVTMDAGDQQQFDHARVSCIAGPCPFTKIESGATPSPGRKIVVQVLDWSDTVTFLVEAEVTRSTPSDAVRQAYPAIYGRSLSFTLPASAQGLSIEADLNGAEIVFPLGPALDLSWADCSLQVGANQAKLYQCELKPGFQFR